MEATDDVPRTSAASPPSEKVKEEVDAASQQASPVLSRDSDNVAVATVNAAASKKVKLKLHYNDSIRLVVVKSGDSFSQLTRRLEEDYGFQPELRYQDNESDHILLHNQNDLNELIANEGGTVNVSLTRLEEATPPSASPAVAAPGSASTVGSIKCRPLLALARQAAAGAASSPSRVGVLPGSCLLPESERAELLRNRPGLGLTRALSDCHLNAARSPNFAGCRRLSTRAKIKWKRGNEIGRGAYGVVYMGLNQSTGEIMAVKVLRTEGLTRKEIDAFENEINVLRNTSHRNIVKYYGIERTDTSLSIFLEYVPGGSVLGVLTSVGSFGEQVIRLYSQQLLMGLEFLHRNGVAHRDIKAANALVANDGSIKLVDFGLSKSVRGQAGMSTSDGGLQGIKGSAFWMAPEILQTEKLSFHGWQKADVWSVGCTIVEMATGLPPRSDLQPMAALFKLSCSDEMPDLPQHLSDSAKDFLRRCFQRDPEQRPTAATLLRHPWLANLTPTGDQGGVGGDGRMGGAWSNWGDWREREHNEYQEYSSDQEDQDQDQASAAGESLGRETSEAFYDVGGPTMGSFEEVAYAEGIESAYSANTVPEAFPHDGGMVGMAGANALTPGGRRGGGPYVASQLSAGPDRSVRMTSAGPGPTSSLAGRGRGRPPARLLVSDSIDANAAAAVAAAAALEQQRSASLSTNSTPSMAGGGADMGFDLSVETAPPSVPPEMAWAGPATSPGPRAAAGSAFGGPAFAFPSDQSPYYRLQGNTRAFFGQQQQPSAGAAAAAAAAVVARSRNLEVLRGSPLQVGMADSPVAGGVAGRRIRPVAGLKGAPRGTYGLPLQLGHGSGGSSAPPGADILGLLTSSPRLRMASSMAARGGGTPPPAPPLQASRTASSRSSMTASGAGIGMDGGSIGSAGGGGSALSLQKHSEAISLLTSSPRTKEDKAGQAGGGRWGGGKSGGGGSDDGSAATTAAASGPTGQLPAGEMWVHGHNVRSVRPNFMGGMPHGAGFQQVAAAGGDEGEGLDAPAELMSSLSDAEISMEQSAGDGRDGDRRGSGVASSAGGGDGAAVSAPVPSPAAACSVGSGAPPAGAVALFERPQTAFHAVVPGFGSVGGGCGGDSGGGDDGGGGGSSVGSGGTVGTGSAASLAAAQVRAPGHGHWQSSRSGIVAGASSPVPGDGRQRPRPASLGASALGQDGSKPKWKGLPSPSKSVLGVALGLVDRMRRPSFRQSSRDSPVAGSTPQAQDRPFRYTMGERCESDPLPTGPRGVGFVRIHDSQQQGGGGSSVYWCESADGPATLSPVNERAPLMFASDAEAVALGSQPASAAAAAMQQQGGLFARARAGRPDFPESLVRTAGDHGNPDDATSAPADTAVTGIRDGGEAALKSRASSEVATR